MTASPQASVPAPSAPLRVLVTGGAGFIGASLVRELLERGATVVALDDLSSGSLARLEAHARFGFEHADVGQPGALAGLLAVEEPFDALVHFAARVGVRAVLRDPEACRREHRAGVRELLRAVEALPAHQRPRVFYASSSEVYEDVARALREGDPERSVEGLGRWAYAAAKLEGERALDAARSLWPAARAPVHLRFFNVVGPGQDAAGGMVLANFVERALEGSPLPVHGNGSAVRTFAHVDEVALTLAELVAHPALPGGALNVGGRARASVIELARCVLRLSGATAGIESVDPRADCGPSFEPVLWREPALERLRALGVSTPAMELDAIVADTLARHGGLSGGRARLALGRAPVRRSACASPAS